MLRRFGLALIAVWFAGCETEAYVIHVDAGDRPEASTAQAQVKTDAAPAPVVVPADAEPPPVGPDAAVVVDTPPPPPPPPPKLDAAPVVSTDPPLPAHPSCNFGRQTLRKLPPVLLMVLDRSGSMRETTTGTQTRWSETVAAIDEVVTKTSGVVEWGLKFFPTSFGCNIDDGLDVTPALNNQDRLMTRVRSSSPVTGTGEASPLHTAVSTGVDYLRILRAKGPRYIVVATDGQPNCDGSSGSSASIAAVRAAADDGFRTFVLGVAREGSAEDKTLGELALAGRQTNGTSKYYNVSRREHVTAALQQITTQVTSCAFALDVAPPAPQNVALYIDGQRVADAQWTYGAERRSVEVSGPSCEALKSKSAPNVQMIFGCPNVPVP